MLTTDEAQRFVDRPSPRQPTGRGIWRGGVGGTVVVKKVYRVIALSRRDRIYNTDSRCAAGHRRCRSDGNSRPRSCEYMGTAGLNRMPKEA